MRRFWHWLLNNLAIPIFLGRLGLWLLQKLRQRQRLGGRLYHGAKPTRFRGVDAICLCEQRDQYLYSHASMQLHQAVVDKASVFEDRHITNPMRFVPSLRTLPQFF